MAQNEKGLVDFVEGLFLAVDKNIISLDNAKGLLLLHLMQDYNLYLK